MGFWSGSEPASGGEGGCSQGLAEHKDAVVHAILTFAMTQSSVKGTAQGAPPSTKSTEWKGPHRRR